MTIVRGRGVQTFTIGTTAARIAQVNRQRAAITLLAASTNTGTLYVSYDDPDVASSGNKLGVPLAAGATLTESPPAVFQGELHAIGSAAGQVIQVVETDELPD